MSPFHWQMTLLEHARSGDFEGLTERLAGAVRNIECSGGPATIAEVLVVEAFDCATRGDFDEATHRLRLRSEPKWSSEAECVDAYNKAMQEKGRASA